MGFNWNGRARMMDARTQGPIDRPVRSPSAVDEGALIDLHHIAGIIRRRIWVILGVSAIMLIATAAAYLMAEPRYVATARVALERSREQVLQVQQVVPDVPPDSAAVDTEVQVLKSPELAARVVDKLKLIDDPEFNPALEKGFTIPADEARKTAVTILLSRLEAVREGFSYAITINFESTSPATAARVVNALAEIYVAAQVEEKSGATNRAATFLEAQLNQLRAQVQTAEAAVAQYRAAHGLFDASAGSTITQEELSGLNSQVAQARAAQAEAEARLSEARSQLARGSTGEELGEALDSPVVSALRSQRAQVSAKVASLRQRYGSGYPELRNAEEELRDLDDQINSEVKRIVANVSSQASAARQRTSSLAGSLNATEGTLAENNRAGVRLAELERNAESARVLYQAFLDRYKQTRAQRGLERSNSHIIARAGVPTFPATPNLMIFIAAGIVSALAASAIAVAILQLMERGIETSDGVERMLGISSLGSVPDTARLPELSKEEAGMPATQIIVDKPQSAFAEAFRRLRTSIHFALPEARSAVVAVTSSLPGEGKTTSAICLARSAALAGVKVVLVDCDIRRRSSSLQFSPLRSIGLAKLLAGKGTLDEALFVDEATGAYVLAQRPDDSSNISLSDSPAFAALLAELRVRFDLVVLDTPPVLPVDDSRVVSAMADGVVMLVRWRKTPAKAAELALRQLDEVGANVIGASLTLVDMVQQTRVGYGDVGYYYSAYKSYYA